MTERKSALQRKDEAAQAALELAYSVGADQVTTAMIAKKLGVSQPALYKYFSSKEDIWQAVECYLGARIEQNISACAAANHDPVNHVRALVLNHLKLVKDYPALPEIMILRTLRKRKTRVTSQTQTSMLNFRKALVVSIKAAVSKKYFVLI